ncbi:dienelactone hydrolase family protein [Candidatus Nitrosocosmicus hydrocola]|uniref:dienelactone hydrolase family protein n=1 Tax=Candidatus Nitrosocosmicus hydrocola TaxID=1826872 RepID=UPI000A5F5250|nr:alpha/beta fold hydrolase [Candidatus Nitrosocosmicus hydrocola]
MEKLPIPTKHSRFSILILLVLTVVFVPGVIFANAQTNSSNGSSNQTITVSGDISNSDNLVSSNGTLSLSNNSAPLNKENVIYYKNTSGYLVYPENTSVQGDNKSTAKLPGVVMIHEWWGLNDQIRNMADELAKEGYAVLAVDLYNGKVAASPDEAMSLVSTARENQNESNSNTVAAVDYLMSLDNVDSSKIISIGWCFGGGQALQLALNADPTSPMAATVLYYGNLVTDQQQLSKINGPVLGIFGGEDQSISVSEVNEFEQALNANNITNEIYIYEGVGHAFANPTGESFAPNELMDAWKKTVEFLDSHVKKD